MSDSAKTTRVEVASNTEIAIGSKSRLRHKAVFKHRMLVILKTLFIDLNIT